MSAVRPAGFLALAATLAGTVGGCATLDTWRKCGAGCPGDAEISAAVRTRLYQHTEMLAPNRVYVSTLDGVVYLSGEVVTDTQRLDAENIAHAAPGVTRVVNVISLEFQGW